MLFRQGFSYVAGFDKPWVVGIGTIADRVSEEGFKVLFAKECDEHKLPFIIPSQGGTCGDEYDWIAAVVRIGPSRWIDVPDRVAWIVEVPPPVPPPPPPEIEQPPGGPPTVRPPPPPTKPALAHTKAQDDKRRTLHVAAEAAALAAVAPVMWLSAREVRTPVLRYGLQAGAVATVLVDGYLLWSYLSR